MASFFLILLIYLVVILFLLPMTILHLVIGFAYCMVFHSFWLGLIVGTLVSFTCSYIGGITAFLLGRYVLASFIRRWLKRSKMEIAAKLRIIDSMFVESGILLVALLRLMFIPYGLTSYVLGATSVSFSDYAVGTLFFIIDIGLMVLLGCTLYLATVDENGDAHPDLNEVHHDAASTAILILEIVFTILITVGLTIWAKCYFDTKYDEAQ